MAAEPIMRDPETLRAVARLARWRAELPPFVDHLKAFEPLGAERALWALANDLEVLADAMEGGSAQLISTAPLSDQ